MVRNCPYAGINKWMEKSNNFSNNWTFGNTMVKPQTVRYRLMKWISKFCKYSRIWKLSLDSILICFNRYYPTLRCDIQGFRAMGLSVQYWTQWFQDFPAIWLAVPFGTNGAHLGRCTLPEKIFFVCEINCFPKGELVLWSLDGDKLSLCRNQQMNGKI